MRNICYDTRKMCSGFQIHRYQVQAVWEVAYVTTDETAYQRYLDGESDAADLLVEKYADLLICYINAYIKDIHEAEDLMIEAFSRIFAKERPISGNGSFKAYLYKTARNLALRHQKKCGHVILWMDHLEFELPDNILTETRVFLDERNRQLYAALDKLKPEYREAVYLFYFEGMSYRNVAAVMSKSEQQIKNLVYRGKQRLKSILDQEGFEYADE